MRRFVLASFLGLLLPMAPLRAGEVAPASAERPAFDRVAAVGLEMDAAAKTWTVAGVAEDAPADRAGLHVGDRILQWDGHAAHGTYAAAMHAGLEKARAADEDALSLAVRLKRGGATLTKHLAFSLAELDVLVVVTKALDHLADELRADPHYETTRPRSYYAPIIHAPLAGLAFAASGSTRSRGRHAAALRTVLAYVMKNGGVRKPNQDAINKAVGGNICSLTHNAGFNAMFLAQLLDREGAAAKVKGAKEGAKVKLRFTEAQIRKKLRVCCRSLEEIQLPNGGWQHGSGGRNMLGYTHLMAATVTAMNGLAMAQQVGVKVKPATVKKGIAYIRKATSGGHVGYAVGNRGSFSAGRNAAVLQIFRRLGLGKDALVAPVLAMLTKNLAKAGTGHGSPVWHLFYAGLATANLDPEGRAHFDDLYRARLIDGQQADGTIRAPEAPGTKPGKGEENRVWGALYTTPLIAMTLLAPYRPHALLFDFTKTNETRRGR